MTVKTKRSQIRLQGTEVVLGKAECGGAGAVVVGGGGVIYVCVLGKLFLLLFFFNCNDLIYPSSTW